MPNAPTAVFKSRRYPWVVERASDSAPPTTGTKVPMRNLAALEATVSLLEATMVCRDKSPTNRVSSSPSAQVTTVLTALATAFTWSPGARFPTMQNAR